MRGKLNQTATALALTVASVIIGVVGATPAAAMSISAYQKTSTYPFSRSSTNGIDPLRYYMRQCVSYAGWWLLHVRGVKVYKAGSASNWKAWAKAHHHTVNHTPSVGAVAWWYHHVAVITKVNSSSIVVHEYNWGTRFGYGSRTIKKGSRSWPVNILHINN